MTISQVTKSGVLACAFIVSGCAGEQEMLAPGAKPDFVYDTSLSPEDIRDCIVNLHNGFNSMEETKKEIIFTSTALKGFYTPYYVIRIVPAGTGSHVDVHIGLLGTPMFVDGGKACLDKLPPPRQ